MRISDWSSDVCSSDLLYLDGSGESYSLNSTQLLGGRLGFSDDETAASTSAVRASEGLADGNNWAVGGYRTDQILDRSEEHTSELQSLMRISYAVFCLKKKKRNIR